MSKLLVHPGPPDARGCVLSVTPQSAGWAYIGFAVHRLAAGQSFGSRDKANETCVILLSGRANIVAGDQRFGEIGGRASVFDPVAPYSVYVPAGAGFEIVALTNLEVALCRAPGGGGHGVRLIAPGDVKSETRGQGANRRFVNAILPESSPAHSLLIFEVITPGGNWSSYPPHKHDHDCIPAESALEETYYHRLNPAQGFAFQRVYTDDRSLDETLCVEDGDVVLVPKGYHPVGAPYGYDLYYLNVMAGPKRKWIFKNDPAHEWILK